MHEEEDGAGAEESGQPRFMRLNDLSGARDRPGGRAGGKGPGSADSEAEGLPYPALAPVVFYLSQDSRPRSWCLRTVCNPYPPGHDDGLGGPQGAGHRLREPKAR